MALLKEVTRNRPGLASKAAAAKKAGKAPQKHKPSQKVEEEEEEQEEEEEEEEDVESDEDNGSEDEYQDEIMGISNEDEEMEEEEEEEEEEEKEEKPQKAKQEKKKGKEKAKGKEEVHQADLGIKKRKHNKVLLLSSRGIITRFRYLMKDLHKLLPHCRKENKLDSKSKLYLLNEIADIHNCNFCIYLESRKKQDLYMWFAKAPEGPTMKFYVQNLHNMQELKMTGNSLKGSRPLLSFDAKFDQEPHFQLIKEMFIQIFGTPKGHPKSKPFFDHVFTFTIADNRIWFRNYQINESLDEQGNKKTNLVEIGPRFALSLMRIFGGSYGGPTLFQNEGFVSPNEVRRELRKQEALKQEQRKKTSLERVVRRKDLKEPENMLEHVFD